MTLDERTETAEKSYTLYVVLHGEIAMYEDKHADCIRLFAPVMPDHVYMAGPWLGEKHIPAGSTLALRGTCRTGTTESIHKDKDLILLNKAVPNPVGSWFEIRLPQPERIYRGFVVKIGGVDPPGDAENSPAMADVRPVFQYKATGDAYLQLLAQTGMSDIDTTARLWAPGEGKPGYLSLHIFAENDLPVGPGHVPGAFQMAAGILGSAAALRMPDFPKPSAVAGRVEGLHLAELTLSLLERIDATARMGAEMRSQDAWKPHLLWDPGAAEDHGSGHGSCGPVGG